MSIVSHFRMVLFSVVLAFASAKSLSAEIHVPQTFGDGGLPTISDGLGCQDCVINGWFGFPGIDEGQGGAGDNALLFDTGVVVSVAGAFHTFTFAGYTPNEDAKFLGNFLAAGVTGVRFRARHSGVGDTLVLRATVFDSFDDGDVDWVTSRTAATIENTATDWQTYVISLDPANLDLGSFAGVNPRTVEDILAAVVQFGFRNDPDGAGPGTPVALVPTAIYLDDIELLGESNSAAETYLFSYQFSGTNGNPWSAGAILRGEVQGSVDPDNPDRVAISGFGPVFLDRPGLPLFEYDDIVAAEFNTLPAGLEPTMSFTGMLNNFRACPGGFDPNFPGDCSFSDSPGGGFLIAPSSGGETFATAADGSGDTAECNGPPQQRGCRVTDFPFMPGSWNLVRADGDGDGIAGDIDGTFNGAFNDESDVFSNDFTDQHLGGTTRGTIVLRGTDTVSVSDDADDGVILGASGPGLSLVQMCGPSNLDIFNVLLTDGDQVAVTCGSLMAKVLSGPVEVEVGINVRIIIPEGGNALMEQLPGSLVSVTNLGGAGSPDITVEDDNGSTPVGPGEPPLVTSVDDGSAPAPENLTARAKPGIVSLRWSAVDGADRYDVYRSAVSGGPYELIGSTPHTAFADRDVATGDTWYYVVRSIVGPNSSPDSGEVEVSVAARRRR